ncbi:MarC family protein [Gordonia sp. LUNF6]|uniref:MarC family protein n=1 Tax=unclassified Gordonia (in: high G+C Gram-positive bacteria) TaxID=2657482 RepID=UPI0007840035|nr:MarC family protein [Gordonia sp. QH-12]KXT56723.1 antibiotic resistance protein MarC [Gordonia sp. QH-12]
MPFDVSVYTTTAITLLVIMDPPGQVPVFLSLVGRRSAEYRRKAAWQAPLVSLLVISLFAVGGRAILAYLHIGIPALQGAGGLLLLLVALQLLMGLGGSTAAQVSDDVNVALVPLGTPMLAGPGAIAAVIVAVSQVHGEVPGYTAIAAAILTVHAVVALALFFSTGIIRVLRVSGITLLAKIAGLLLAAIAVQLIATSVIGFAATA